MQPMRPDLPTDPASAPSVGRTPAAPGAEAALTDFSDSEGGLFAGPASLLPEVEPAAGEPPVRSLFAPRGLFRL